MSRQNAKTTAPEPTREGSRPQPKKLTALEAKGVRLSPEDLRLLATQLAAASDPSDAAHIKERLTRGFYGI